MNKYTAIRKDHKHFVKETRAINKQISDLEKKINHHRKEQKALREERKKFTLKELGKKHGMSAPGVSQALKRKGKK